MTKIFFIGDLHLGHANIIRYCNRPFGSVHEMDDFIVKTWNETVGEDDTVYFLGDMAYGRGSRKTSYWLNRLNGNIVFIKGSHDRSRRIKFHDKLILNHKNHEFLLVHNPRDVPDGWDGWVIHAHVHNNSAEYPFVSRKNKTINVSAELLNYRPISFGELIAAMEQGNENVETHIRGEQRPENGPDNHPSLPAVRLPPHLGLRPPPKDRRRILKMDRRFRLTFWPLRVDHRLLDLLWVLPGVVAGLGTALARKGVGEAARLDFACLGGFRDDGFRAGGVRPRERPAGVRLQVECFAAVPQTPPARGPGTRGVSFGAGGDESENIWGYS